MFEKLFLNRHVRPNAKGNPNQSFNKKEKECRYSHFAKHGLLHPFGKLLFHNGGKYRKKPLKLFEKPLKLQK